MIDFRELNCESEVLSLQVAMRNSFMMTFFQCLLQHNDLWLPFIFYHRLATRSRTLDPPREGTRHPLLLVLKSRLCLGFW